MSFSFSVPSLPKMKGPISRIPLAKIVLSRIQIFLGTLLIVSGGFAGSTFDFSSLSFSERAIAVLLDKTLNGKAFQFEDTVLIPADSPGNLTPMTIGTALVWNAKLNRGVNPNSYGAVIKTQLRSDGKIIGDLIFRWHSSHNFWEILVGLLKYRMDRAYLWPQWVIDRFPQYFQPISRQEPFELEWQGVQRLQELEQPRPIFEFLRNVLAQMQVYEPNTDHLVLQGKITSYGDAQTNKIIFVFDVLSNFEGALRCQQRIKSNYNLFTNEVRFLKGSVQCEWPES